VEEDDELSVLQPCCIVDETGGTEEVQGDEEAEDTESPETGGGQGDGCGNCEGARGDVFAELVREQASDRPERHCSHKEGRVAGAGEGKPVSEDADGSEDIEVPGDV
jgi:hypothetical protein